MAEIEIRHMYDCDEDTFWKEVFFDEAFNRKMFLEHLAFNHWEVTAFEEDDSAGSGWAVDLMSKTDPLKTTPREAYEIVSNYLHLIQIFENQTSYCNKEFLKLKIGNWA